MADAANYNFIDVLGIAELSSGDQAKAFRTIGQAVFESVLLRVMEELDDEQKKERPLTTAQTEPKREGAEEPRPASDASDDDWGAVPAFLRRSKLK